MTLLAYLAGVITGLAVARLLWYIGERYGDGLGEG